MAPIQRQSSVLGFLLRVAFVVIVMQFMRGMVHLLGAGRHAPKVTAKEPPKPLVDRASAIDVPFTEEG